jgi:DNA polymerase
VAEAEADVNVVGQMADDSLESAGDSWNFLQKQVAECKECILSETRRQTVFGWGDVNAEWMLVGEAPSQDGEMEGKPFSGQSGFLLTEMLRAMGLQPETIYSTNIVKCCPPENKDPKVEALRSCADYLQRQIALVKPKIILAVGRIAAQALLGTKQPLSELREQHHRINGIPVVVTYHPAYLLRSLPEKRKAWQDLQLALKIYQQEK